MINLIDVMNGDLCAGCGFCQSASAGEIKMHYDKAGFIRPDKVNSLSKELVNNIEGVCPGIHGEDVVTVGNYVAKNIDYMWGEYHRCGVGYSTNEEIRFKGSSGGAITQIAVWLLESKQIDAVLVTDYDAEDKIKTISKVTNSVSEVIDCSGSKYAPSSPLTLLSNTSQIKGRVAVIGKPCDITALRRAKNQKNPLADNINILISFFCAGVPSDNQNEKLIHKLGVKDRKDLIGFKHRGNGWPGKTVAETKDGDRFECTYNESWGKVLNKDLQFRCKICPDGIGEAADIVCADAWYGEDGYPSFEEAEGRSLIMSRTLLGDEVLESAVAHGRLEFTDLNPREIDKMQPGQLRRRQQLGARIIAIKMAVGNAVKVNARALSGYSVGLSIKDRFKAVLGMWIRMYKKKSNK